MSSYAESSQWFWVMLPVAEPSSVCVPVIEPVGLLSAACVAGSSVCSTPCAAGSALPAAYLTSHTENKITLAHCYRYPSAVAMVKRIHGNSNFCGEFIISMCIMFGCVLVCKADSVCLCLVFMWACV